MQYAQISNDKVKNIIVVDSDNADLLAKLTVGFDKLVRVDELESKPAIGDDHINDEFIKPEVVELTTKKSARIISMPDETVEVSDSVLILDTTGEGGMVNLPQGQDGMEYSFGLKGVGAATYKLKPAEGDVLDFMDLVVGPSRIKFVEKTWIAIG